MSSLLPVSDLDNPHVKRKMQYSTRFKISTIVGLCTVLAFVVFGLSKSPFGNYSDYLPKSKSEQSSGSVSPPSGSAGSALECTKSYDGKKPITQYVVMIDAGSSGSRVHVYEFNNCGPLPVLADEKFVEKSPGLSSYEAEPESAAKSLDSLLKVAMETIPEELHKCSPVSVKATAGLRKLGETNAAAILEAVRVRLETEYPFPVIDDGVSIMSGEDEGVYAWITANYLLGNIGSSAKTPTVAVFDLGGGSTQIVFEPTFRDSKEVLKDGEHKYPLSFGGRDFTLYQHSYLGFGLNEAIKKINQEVVKSQKGPHGSEYTNPCVPPGATYTAVTQVPDGSVSREGENTVDKKVTFVGPKVASPLQCRAMAEKILDKDHVCANPPCTFGGVHQPKLFNAFPMESDMYVFSFFYDRTAPLGMPSTFSLSEMSELTSLVCRGSEAYSAFESIDGAVEALEANPQWCTELSYMEALLRTGYEIKGHREVKIAKKINGRELGWCLGASLPLLDGTNWQCRK